LLIAFILNFKYIKEIFIEIGNKYSWLLILISIIGILTTSFIAPRIHRIYFDEDIYNNIGQCIADHKRAVLCNEGYYENNELKVIDEVYNKQPQGHPYLISIIFRIFGTNELFVFISNNIILGLTVIVIFLIAFLLFKNIFASLVACLSYIFIPVNLHWFNTCASEPSTAFFISMTTLASLIYLKNKRPINLFFLATTLAFTLNFRMESLLISIAIGLAFILKDVKIFIRKELYIFGALLFLLSTGIILHLYMVRGESWGATTGPKLSLDYFPHNFSTNSIYYFSNKEFPLIFSILAIIGILFYKNKSYIKEKLIVFVWFSLFFGVFLFFYAGSYRNGQQIRFSVLSYVPISIFVGLGVSFIRNLLENKIKSIKLILILLMIFNFTWFLPFIRAEGEEAWAARAAHKYETEFAKLLPENSIVYTHNPNILLLNKQSAIQSASGTYKPGIIEQHLERFKGGVYILRNYWSNVDDPVQRGFTENLLNKYEYNTIKEYDYRSYKFGLYKIIGEKDIKEKK
jgi:4-amino-4-deoxy-L-arabinose transferase-like glycosyltransferase